MGREMDRTVKACTECARMCSLIHGKSSSSNHGVTSFFSIMIGNSFSQQMSLPCKFARFASTMAGQNVNLEDSSGQLWKVKVNEANGSLVFQHGWSTFAADHDLEFGDFVLFFRIRELHFVVKIYDKTICEKVDFSGRTEEEEKRVVRKRKGSKRRRKSYFTKKCGPSVTTSRNSFDDEEEEHGLSALVSSDSDVVKIDDGHENSAREVPSNPKFVEEMDYMIGHENSAREVPSKPEVVEEMDYMIGRGVNENRGEEREWDFDLSIFEAWTPDERVIGVQNNDLVIGDNEAAAAKEVVAVMVSEEAVPSVARNTNNRESISDKGSSSLSVMPVKDVPTIGEGDNRTSADINQQTDQKEVNGNFPATEQITKVIHDEKTAQNLHVIETEVIKEEHVETKSNLGRHAEHLEKVLEGESSKAVDIAIPQSVGTTTAPSVVKIEIIDVDEYYTTTTTPIKFSPILATCGQSCIELPEPLPYPVIYGKKDFERKTMILRDPAQRLWPVAYHEKPSTQFLAGGWECLCKANRINPGDQCLFALENETEAIYSVRVV